MVDRERCIECKACLWICPYGAPRFNDGKMVLCNLCIDRLREGKKTACEAACQASAITVVPHEEIAELRSRKAVERITRGAVE